MAYYRTFDEPTTESYKEPDIEDCTECGSNRTTYLYCVGGVEIRRCFDCDNQFEVEEE